jgi:transcriptional regulator with XRE-family HTH domain
MHLRHYLETNRIYFYEFAAKIGVTPTYLSDIVRGQRKPSLKLLIKIVEASNGAVSYDDVVKSTPADSKRQPKKIIAQ